jgi:hypothetical protein
MIAGSFLLFLRMNFVDLLISGVDLLISSENF